LALTWPLRSAGIGAGVGGSISHGSAAPAGSQDRTRSIVTNRRRMNFLLLNCLLRFPRRLN
jgi:hypothetical protein